MDIIAKSTYSEERARDFFRFHLFRISPSKYVYFGLSIILLIASVVFTIIGDYYFALFFLFLSILILIVRIATINMTVKKVLKDNRFPSTHYTLKFNNDIILYQTEMYKKEFSWKEIIGVFETSDYIYFYYKQNSALILAKYILKKEERESLSDIIRLSNVKYKKSKFK